MQAPKTIPPSGNITRAIANRPRNAPGAPSSCMMADEMRAVGRPQPRTPVRKMYRRRPPCLMDAHFAAGASDAQEPRSSLIATCNQPQTPCRLMTHRSGSIPQPTIARMKQFARSPPRNETPIAVAAIPGALATRLRRLTAAAQPRAAVIVLAIQPNARPARRLQRLLGAGD